MLAYVQIIWAYPCFIVVKEDITMLYYLIEETLVSYMICCWTNIITLQTKHDHVLYLIFLYLIKIMGGRVFPNRVDSDSTSGLNKRRFITDYIYTCRRGIKLVI